MKTVATALVALGILLALAGCESKSTPSQEPGYTRVSPTASKEALAAQEAIAKVEAQKRIALEQINAQVQMKRMEMERQQSLEMLRERERLMRLEHEQAKERYMIWAAIALMILAGLTILWYFDRRRQDKLIAYRDNLHKYFLFKENETRMKIAEKIIDTVGRQEISPEEKAKLIEVLHAAEPGKERLLGAGLSEAEPPETAPKKPQETEEPEETVIDIEEEPPAPEPKRRPWYRFW